MRTALRLTAQKQRPFVPKEYDEQVGVFDYARAAAHKDWRWEMLFSTLNGVRLSIGLAKKMKRAGNRTGVPDLILPVANGGYFGWFGEGKRIKGGVISDAQREFMKRLADGGYKVEIWRGAKDAITAITAYLALPPTMNP